MFTRSKRSKTQPQSELEQPSLVPPTTKRGRKAPKDREENVTITAMKAKSQKLEILPSSLDLHSMQQPKRRKSTRLSGQGAQNEAQHNATEINPSGLDDVDIIGGAEESQPSIVETVQSTMISLPFSDTPIINRNKELRMKCGEQRRSSLGMRGRRASSLIDSGHSALPHREVETHEFYKHIEATGPSEPRRMKQLLTWVGERALSAKPLHGKDSAAELAGMWQNQFLGHLLNCV